MSESPLKKLEQILTAMPGVSIACPICHNVIDRYCSGTLYDQLNVHTSHGCEEPCNQCDQWFPVLPNVQCDQSIKNIMQQVMAGKEHPSLVDANKVRTMPTMKWVETTLRKGTASPRICRDMFIVDTHGRYVFCEVKNGSIVTKRAITESEAKSMIDEFQLVPTKSNAFNHSCTYRCKNSAALVNSLLAGL